MSGLTYFALNKEEQALELIRVGLSNRRKIAQKCGYLPKRTNVIFQLFVSSLDTNRQGVFK